VREVSGSIPDSPQCFFLFLVRSHFHPLQITIAVFLICQQTQCSFSPPQFERSLIRKEGSDPAQPEVGLLAAVIRSPDTKIFQAISAKPGRWFAVAIAEEAPTVMDSSSEISEIQRRRI
jgi:hypothetical protein